MSLDYLSKILYTKKNNNFESKNICTRWILHIYITQFTYLFKMSKTILFYTCKYSISLIEQIYWCTKRFFVSHTSFSVC